LGVFVYFLSCDFCPVESCDFQVWLFVFWVVFWVWALDRFVHCDFWDVGVWADATFARWQFAFWVAFLVQRLKRFAGCDFFSDGLRLSMLTLLSVSGCLV